MRKVGDFDIRRKKKKRNVLNQSGVLFVVPGR